MEENKLDSITWQREQYIDVTLVVSLLYVQNPLVAGATWLSIEEYQYNVFDLLTKKNNTII